jgi:hypothetical protein
MERRVTNCDGLEIVVSMDNRVSDAITDWARVAEMYETKTEITLEILGEYFLTKNQFVVFHSEIKYYVSKGLSEKDSQILAESSLYLNDRTRTPEILGLREQRKIVKRKINKIYNRLLLELFPSFKVSGIEPLKIVITNEAKSRTRTVSNEDESTVGYNETRDEEDSCDDEYVHDDDNPVNISELSIGEAEPAKPAVQRTRPRYSNVSQSLPQDLFETPENALMLLDPVLSTLEGKVIFEPCCGNGAIVRYLENKGFTVISRDLYTTDLKQDYLVEEDPDYDVLITNPRKE